MSDENKKLGTCDRHNVSIRGNTVHPKNAECFNWREQPAQGEPRMETVVKSFTLPSGGKMKVTITAEGPIAEQDFPILRDKIALGMGEYMQNLADVMRPKS